MHWGVAVTPAVSARSATRPARTCESAIHERCICYLHGLSAWFCGGGTDIEHLSVAAFSGAYAAPTSPRLTHCAQINGVVDHVVSTLGLWGMYWLFVANSL